MEEFERFLQKAQRLQEMDPQEQHISESLLTAYVYDQLLDEQASRVAAHLVQCALCSERVTVLRSERARLEQSLASYLQIPSTRKPSRMAFSLVGESLQRWWKLFAPWQPALVHTGIYAAAAVLLFWANAWLDRVLISPPAGTPPLEPWWASFVRYAPWLLAPWAIGLMAHWVFCWRKSRHR
jgi:anti-sigma factor RsiW